ncbi:MAG: hypothetical protein IPQ19_09210 [Bacteroidetes bacterium]|nr:hypothetical protein [Bacteroidota bacterium]
MNHNYIYPKHKSYDSVEIFLTEKPIKEELHLYDSNLKNIEFINLEQNERALILGEPGVGKSELLKEYFNYLKEKEVQLAFFDLKTLKFLVDLEKKRDSFFEDAIAFISQKPNKIVGENLLENNFDFGNTQSKTLILDGLDEIDTEYFEVIWKEIIQF